MPQSEHEMKDQKRIEELEHKLMLAECEISEWEECSSDLFGLCCDVLDNTEKAAASRARIEEHIKHVRECRKGSCDIELNGSRQRQRAEKAEAMANEMAWWIKNVYPIIAKHVGPCTSDQARKLIEEWEGVRGKSEESGYRDAR